MASHGPPGGLPPDTSRGPELLRAIWIMDGIAAAIVFLRITASISVLRKISVPDYLMIAALLFGIANNACLTVSEHWGLGRHIFYLTPVQIVTALKWQTIAEPLGILSPTLGRLSFTLYLFKIIGTDKLKRYILHFCIWSNVIVNVLTIILIFAQCGLHVTAIWDEHAPGAAQCWSHNVQSDFGFFQGAVNALIDLILTVLPAWVVYHLQLPQRIKIALMILLGLSLFAAVASIVKTVKLAVFSQGDLTYNFIPFAIWFTVENNIVIAAASIPAIKPLFSKKKAGTAYGSYAMGGYGHSNGYGGSNPKSKGYLSHNQSEITSSGNGDFPSRPGITKQTTIIQEVVSEDGGRMSRGGSEVELTHAV